MKCNQTDPWRPMGYALDLYILPVTCIIGLVLNTACLFVFTQRRSHPLVPALIVLSVCDSLQLLISLFVLYLPALHDHLEMDPNGTIAQVAYIATGALAGGLLTSNCASIWTMCYISVQRYRAIVKPLTTHAARRASTWPLFAIFLAALLFNAPVWFEYSWFTDEIVMENGEKSWMIFHMPSMLRQSQTYNLIMRKILYPSIVYLIPLFLISYLNMQILTHINASQAAVQTLTYRRHMDQEQRSVWLLISIVVFFFMCHTGGLLIRFVDQQKYEQQPCFVFTKDLVNFLFNVNSFVNPMLYFFFTKQFKDLTTTWYQNGASKSVTKLLIRRLSSRSTSAKQEQK